MAGGNNQENAENISFIVVSFIGQQKHNVEPYL